MTDGATIATNAAVISAMWTCLLTSAVGATRILGLPTGAYDGQPFLWRFKQPASGGPCGITLAAGFDLGPLAESPVLPVTANAVAYLAGYWEAATSHVHLTGFMPGYGGI